MSRQSDMACDGVLVYFGPTIHPSSSNSSGITSDSSSFNGHQNGPSLPSEIPPSYVFPAMNLHYQSWEHHSPPFSTSNRQIDGSDQTSIPPVSQRSAKNSSDMPRPRTFMHPFVAGYRYNPNSGTRTASAITSSFIPPYPGSNARARDRVQALQAYYQHHHPSTFPTLQTPIVFGSQRLGSHRSHGHGHVGLVASLFDHMGGFYLIPLVKRDPGWGAFHEAATSGSDPGCSFCQRLGFERPPSQVIHSVLFLYALTGNMPHQRSH
ncbi:hypothetical protein PVK06_013899 [Gossypium arboreum]|uniref:Uncharacterized protein n=1 Tax=Gossypium arboreum TaxID=29729 RepID=A0ABR0PT38_GOSAR|nr:hypothetical protein PVK06_013899 [Gossypium arboreum]